MNNKPSKRNEERDGVPKRKQDIETRLKEVLRENVDLRQEIACLKKRNRQLLKENHKLTSSVNDLATDDLTGIFNREGLKKAFEETLISDYGAIIFIDLDKFKPINDTYGHDAGDKALSEVGKLLRHNIRGSNDMISLYKLPDEDYEGSPEIIDNNSLLARFGGDEFLVILENISPENAQQKLETLQAAFDDLSFEWKGKTIRFGASLGMETFKRGDNLDDIRRSADTKMYDAKKKKGIERDTFKL